MKRRIGCGRLGCPSIRRPATEGWFEPMLEVLITSQGLLWLVVLALLLVVIALVRQIGLLHERLAPLGGLVIDGGPPVGAVAPRFELPTLDGAMASIGPPAAGYDA